MYIVALTTSYFCLSVTADDDRDFAYKLYSNMLTSVPLLVLFFKVPQHYKLMGYQPVSAFEAAASYIPPTQPRKLLTGAQVSQETTHQQHCGTLT